jgi:hypothetical protein
MQDDSRPAALIGILPVMLFGDECQPEPTCSEPYHWDLPVLL